MKRRISLPILAVLTLSSFAVTGCENLTVGVGVSGYNASTGMSYGVGTSTGPYGTYNSVSVGYSSGGYSGHPYGHW